MESKDLLKREGFLELGPGGMKCPCCRPGLGKARDEFRRRARRRMKQKLHRLIEPETDEQTNTEP